MKKEELERQSKLKEEEELLAQDNLRSKAEREAAIAKT